MTRNEGVLADSPIVVDEMNVTVADSAVRDLHFDFIHLQFARIVLVRQQMRTGGMDRQTMNLTHLVYFPNLRPRRSRERQLNATTGVPGSL